MYLLDETKIWNKLYSIEVTFLIDFSLCFSTAKDFLVVLRFYVVEQVLLLLLFGGKQEEEHKIIDFSHKNQFIFVF